jgi:hypothetical protein
MKTLPTDRKISYVKQYQKCGKPTCACKDGRKHGPYIYAEWRENGRPKTAYVGKYMGE